MSSPSPQAPTPQRSPGRRPRGWEIPVLVGLGVVALLLIGAIVAGLRRDDASGAIPAAAPTTSRPSTDAPPDREDADGDDPADQDGDVRTEDPGLLDGSAGAVSPQCLGLDGLDGLLGSGDELTGSLEDQVSEIAERVATQRGLEWTTELAPRFLPAEEFDARVANSVREDYPAAEADLDSRTLILLGAVPAGTDLLETQADLLAGQVAGFYDPETQEIVVRDDGDADLDPSEEVTLAHELDHALTDQALGLPDTAVAGDTDANLAALALVEGDATLLMQQYALAHQGLGDQLAQLADPAAAQAQAELEDIAPYLRSMLMYPYLDGLAWACRQYEDGGWPSVDGRYDALPRTSAEILYGRPDEPVDAPDPGEPAGSWTLARRDTVGAAQLRWLFQAPGGDEQAAVGDPAADAARWAGGESTLFTDGEDTALALSLVDRADDSGLCTAVDRWYDASFPDDQRAGDAGDRQWTGGRQVGVLRCDGREVRLGIAPDLATARALAD